MMHFTSVLLPAPFSPSSAWNEPGRTLSSTLSSAMKSPNRMVMAMASTPSAPVGQRRFADDHDSAPISAVEVATAPNTPPCILIIFSAWS